MLLFVLMLTSCISNIVSWFVLHVRGQYWPFAFILNKHILTGWIISSGPENKLDSREAANALYEVSQ